MEKSLSMRPMPVGKDLFEKVRQGNFYYVDKTSLVEELVRAQRLSLIWKSFSLNV